MCIIIQPYVTKNDFRILMDIVIVDSTHTNMVQQTSTMTTHVITMVVQEMTSFPLLLRHMGVSSLSF